jgi:hypothetical protein
MRTGPSTLAAHVIVENSRVDGIRRPGHRRRTTSPTAGRSGATGTVTGPGLDPGIAGFDSPVPDVWAARHWCAVLLGRQRVRGSIPLRSTMPFKLRRQSAGVKYRRLPVRSGRGARMAGSAIGRPSGSQPEETGSTPVLATQGCRAQPAAVARRQRHPGGSTPLARHYADVAQSGQSAVLVRRRFTGSTPVFGSSRL